ncbi:hypothetical protein [Serratia silvae]|uniref:FidL-like membrane protein n=1 Tax=Serratia silvae TaxID=2824122 RepID=A0ABT0KEP7_9GAMM|nr:hypothetical protein [Serratia silvae]MCL1030043.1 hypothetical protein [Serratia silvae]
MKTKNIIPLVILTCATLASAYYLIYVKNKAESISCESTLYYKIFVPKPGMISDQHIIMNLKGNNSRDDGKGRISLTAKYHTGNDTYYVRRDIIISYQVDNNGLYFFKTLYINKYARDTIPENIEKQLLPDIFSKLNSLTGYTIRPAGKQGYLIYITDTPILFCNRL